MGVQCCKSGVIHQSEVAASYIDRVSADEDFKNILSPTNTNENQLDESYQDIALEHQDSTAFAPYENCVLKNKEFQYKSDEPATPIFKFLSGEKRSNYSSINLEGSQKNAPSISNCKESMDGSQPLGSQEIKEKIVSSNQMVRSSETNHLITTEVIIDNRIANIRRENKIRLSRSFTAQDPQMKQLSRARIDEENSQRSKKSNLKVNLKYLPIRRGVTHMNEEPRSTKRVRFDIKAQ